MHAMGMGEVGVHATGGRGGGRGGGGLARARRDSWHRLREARGSGTPPPPASLVDSSRVRAHPTRWSSTTRSSRASLQMRIRQRPTRSCCSDSPTRCCSPMAGCSACPSAAPNSTWSSQKSAPLPLSGRAVMRAETCLLTTGAFGRCVNALAQLGSAASLVHSLGFLAMPEAGPSCAGGEARSFANGDPQHAQQAVHAAMHAHAAAAMQVAQPVQAGSHATAPAAPHATQQMAPTAQQVAPQALEQAPHPHTAQQAPQDAQTEGPASPLWMLADVSQGGDTSRNADNAGQPSASSGAALLAPPPRPPPVRAVPVAATLCRSAVCNVANGTSAEMASTSAAGGSVPAQNATQQSPAWPFGHSPGFSEVAHYLQNNSPRRITPPRTPTCHAPPFLSHRTD